MHRKVTRTKPLVRELAAPSLQSILLLSTVCNAKTSPKRGPAGGLGSEQKSLRQLTWRVSQHEVELWFY